MRNIVMVARAVAIDLELKIELELEPELAGVTSIAAARAVAPAGPSQPLSGRDLETSQLFAARPQQSIHRRTDVNSPNQSL